MYDHTTAVRSLLTEIGAKAKIFCSFPGPIQRIIPERDGFLLEAEFEQAVELTLVVTTPKNRNIQAVIVRSYLKEKPIILKSNKADPSKPYMQFQKMITNRATKDETMSTKHDVNGIRLVLAENGIFQMWEIAVPTRIDGPTANFFLTIQRLYKANMFNLNGQIYMPEHEYGGYQEWIDLQALLAKMVNVETLPKISKPFVAPPTPAIVKGRHQVIFFCLASGLGLAQTSQGPAFIHWKELPRNKRFACVSEGQLIGGDIIATDKSLQLKNIRFSS